MINRRIDFQCFKETSTVSNVEIVKNKANEQTTTEKRKYFRYEIKNLRI